MGQHGSQCVWLASAGGFFGEQNRRPHCAGGHGGQQAAIHAQSRPAAGRCDECVQFIEARLRGRLAFPHEARRPPHAEHQPACHEQAACQERPNKAGKQAGAPGVASWLADSRSLRRRNDWGGRLVHDWWRLKTVGLDTILLFVAKGIRLRDDHRGRSRRDGARDLRRFVFDAGRGPQAQVRPR